MPNIAPPVVEQPAPVVEQLPERPRAIAGVSDEAEEAAVETVAERAAVPAVLPDTGETEAMLRIGMLGGILLILTGAGFLLSRRNAS